MSQESSQAQEKTEQPTPKRLQDAKKKGQVPRSRELNTMAVMLGRRSVLYVAVRRLDYGAAHGDRNQRLSIVRWTRRSCPMEAAAQLGRLVISASVLLLPLMLGLCRCIGRACLARWRGVSVPRPRDPSSSASIPWLASSGSSRCRGLMEFGKTLLKFAVLIGIAMSLLWMLHERVLALAGKPPLLAWRPRPATCSMSFLALAVSACC
jgi:flagellar biosynthesis protein FlhB